MIRLGGLVSQKAFGKFEMGKVISNPFANAFVNEAEGEDHEVSMGQNQLDTIIKMATELKAKMGENEKEIPAWIQDHISKAENYISQAAGNYHEYGTNEASVPTGERIQNLNNRIKALRDKLSATKSPEQKKLFQDRLKNALQTLSNIKKDYSIKKESVNEDSPCWKGYKQVGMKDKNGRQVPNCVPNESVVKEGPMNLRGGIPKMYVAYLGLQKKVRELEDKQKELLQPYLTAKKSNNVTAINKAVDALKKNQKSLEMYRRNLDTVERQYITSLDKDAEYTGED